MFLLSALSAALHLVSATSPIQPKQKAAHLPSPYCSSKSDVTCPFTSGGFHAVCSAVKYQDAAAVCESQGWRLAAIDESNVMYAVQVHQQCGGPRGAEWTASFNGLNQNPCQVITNNGTISVAPQFCRNAQFQVMCQEVPVVATDCTTTTTTYTTSVGTVVISTTVTRHPECRDEKLASPQNLLQEQSRPQLTCNTCNGVCSVAGTDLKIIKKVVPFNQAAEECAKRGWYLADITEGMHAQLLSAKYSCDAFGGIVDPVLWIRSYDGISGGYCSSALVQEESLQADFVYVSGDCNYIVSGLQPYPLCQCSPPVVTGYGPYQGSVTTTSTTTTTTLATVVPQTTVTTTVTHIRRCNHAHCGRRHHRRSSSSSSSSSSSDSRSSSSSEHPKPVPDQDFF